MAEPLDSLKIAEIQLDTLLHVASERGTADAQAGQIGAVLDELLWRAADTYKRTRSNVSSRPPRLAYPHAGHQGRSRTQQWGRVAYIPQLSESIKTSIEHESYASVAPIRELAHSLRHSVSSGISAVERARVLVAHGNGDDVDVKQLESIAARQAGDWVDTRNCELFPAYVGVKEGREPETQGRRLLSLTSTGSGDEHVGEDTTGNGMGMGKGNGESGDVDGAWCSAWADVLLRIASLGNAGGKAPSQSRDPLPGSVSCLPPSRCCDV